MFIYKITNIVNNKVYIGQSIRPIQKRFERHINDATNNILDTHFARAIRKYGKDNFIISLLDTANNQDELNKKEQYWIRFYDSVNCGYNETDATNKCGGNTYQSKTEVELEEIAEKIRESKIGSNNPNANAIKCFNVNTKEELNFDTVKECRDYFGEQTHRFITLRVLHKAKSLYKKEWKIAYKNEEYDDLPEKWTKSGIKLNVFDLDTKQNQIFDSVRLTSRTLGIDRNVIRKHMCNNEKEFIINNYKFTILN